MPRIDEDQDEVVTIYVWGDALTRCTATVGAFNKTAMCCSIGEDYAKAGWGIVIKVKENVNPKDLSMHLRDLADAIDDGFYIAGSFVPNRAVMGFSIEVNAVSVICFI